MPKIERQTDMYLSTLQGYIAALGGELQIVAQFPDRAPGSYHQFQTLEEEARGRSYHTTGGGETKEGINSLKRERTAGS